MWDKLATDGLSCICSPEFRAQAEVGLLLDTVYPAFCADQEQPPVCPNLEGANGRRRLAAMDAALVAPVEVRRKN